MTRANAGHFAADFGRSNQEKGEEMKLLTSALALTLAVSSSLGDDVPEIKGRGEWGRETLGLTCRITTDRTEYTIGEKVYILVEIKNNTDKPIALGLEPLIDTGKGNLSRQPAEIHMTANQGDPGFFSTTAAVFPKGTRSEARAVALKPGETYSETVVRTPWGPTFSSIPAAAQPGEMKLVASLWQFLTGDLKMTCVKANCATFKVNRKRE